MEISKSKVKKLIAIIPARGGSKRLHRKNILRLDNVPLMSRVIRTAKKANIFDQIIVSSEDVEILDIAKKEGIITHNRKFKLATDKATVDEVCLDVLSKYPAKNFCCIYATSALITRNTLLKASKKFLFSKNISVLMGVSKYNYHPFQAIKISKDGKAKLIFSKFKKLKSNFYPNLRVSNGTFYFAKSKEFKKERTFYTNKLKVYDVPETEVSDINTYEDYTKLVSNFSKNTVKRKVRGL